MGLNIGVRVKKQHEGYMSDGYNPRGSSEQIEEEVYQRLLRNFPEPNGFGFSVTCGEQEYDFDVRLSHYGDEFLARGYTFNAVYLALIEYILENFSANYCVDLQVYFVP